MSTCPNNQAGLDLCSASDKPLSFCDEDFQILKGIGEGTFGEVYQAKHKQSEEIVALKKIHYRYPLECFIKERDILTNFKHPNIVKLIGIIENKSPGILVLEYVKYKLDDILLHHSLSEDQRGFLMRQLLEAIVFLHDSNVIHKDIIDRNILISEEGVLKLIDFGEAKILTGASFELEILTKSEDIWNLGRVFTRFYRGEDLFHAAGKIIRPFRKLSIRESSTEDGHSEIPENVPEEAFQLIRQMLYWDPFVRISAKDALKHAYIECFGNTYDCDRMAQWLKGLSMNHDS